MEKKIKHTIKLETEYSRLRLSKPNLATLNLLGLKNINLRLNNNIILTNFDFVNVYGKIKSRAGKCVMNKIFVNGLYSDLTTEKIEMEKDIKDRIDLNKIYDVDVVKANDPNILYDLAYSHLDILSTR